MICILLGPSPLSQQNTDSTPTQYHQPMECSSPSSSGKMMPSGGKGGKPASMSGLVRPSLPPQQQTSQHPVFYNGGKGNPAAGGYPMRMPHHQQQPQQWMSPQQQPQQWMSQQQQPQQWMSPPPPPPPQQQQQQQQQQHRYPTHVVSGGKPMAYSQQRMPYGGDPYMMRQQSPQVPSSPYQYTSNIGK